MHVAEHRAHGVGFYQFSKDEEERQREMEKLKTIRESTKANREAKEKLKEKRKGQLAARLEKVRQRRLAQGKPVPEPKGRTQTLATHSLHSCICCIAVSGLPHKRVIQKINSAYVCALSGWTVTL